jgi:Leucine-rich repeat (LRR) protein
MTKKITTNIEKIQPMATPISDTVEHKHTFENHASFEYSYNDTQITPLKILVAMSNNNRYPKHGNIEKIPRELWVKIFLSLISPRNFEPLFVLGRVCSEFLRISDSMLVSFFHSTTTSNCLLNKINSIVPIRHLNLAVNSFICGLTLTRLTNLKYLDLSRNDTINNNDIHPLTNLTSLNLTNNTKISNMTLLRLGHALTSIDVSCNSIINDLTIKRLTSVTALQCEKSILSDECVSCLTNLRLLNISLKEKVTDKSLIRLSSLTELNANSNGYVTGMSIKNLTNLTALYIGSTRSIDIPESTLKYLTNLTKLNLSNVSFSSQSIKHLDKLQILNIAGTKINTISTLTNLTKLYTNELCSIDEILQLTKLSHLTIPGEFVLTDKVQQLTSLQGLTSLHIKTPNLTDDTLIKFSNLTALYLNETNLITDASIQRLTNLKILDMSGTWSFVNESCLMKLQNLTALNICGTPISVKSLLIHPSLTHLSTSCREKIKNSGLILYCSSDWVQRFSPSPIIVPLTISSLDLSN